MSEHEYSSLIEGHTLLQRRVQPLLKIIHQKNEAISQARSKADALLGPYPRPPATGRAHYSPNNIDKAYRHLAKLTAENDLKISLLCKVIAPQAKKSSRLLCSCIYYDLPREVRDMIYGFLHAHETIYVGPEYFDQTKQPCETDRDAHYWDVDYVGADVQREIVESWYRTTLFYFYDKHNNIEVVTKFLNTDRWQLGIKPRHFIRKARFELDASHPPANMRIEDVHEHTTQGIRPLKNLHLLPNHVSFFIRIHTYGDVKQYLLPSEWMQSIVGDLHRSLNALHRAGHKFVVKWPDYEDLEFNRNDCSLSADEWMERLVDAQMRILSA
ncbi:hypothetical protein LEMA_P111890.1 [Plenodomus lingam JN3]|uniref:Uncharacterized protein n=1 Tax=Leptosphaeria maculans (strain JN3 / isolate v23.1.3 / race Av1-4-5-6-7-8) TaxID=985895 RepID=E4ZY25_LEPMJ|nr:hypothetical protein LEMA_P111890.1 [Plenodomus lingam JN3]CBX96270.1 hypothetical protein LEMA_P111890.1 [Plenodomus lingam JN3]